MAKPIGPKFLQQLATVDSDIKSCELKPVPHSFDANHASSDEFSTIPIFHWNLLSQ